MLGRADFKQLAESATSPDLQCAIATVMLDANEYARDQRKRDLVGRHRWGWNV